ncbi:MarR family winged helix-turn-helix transcriptional regulator [Enterococcus sp. AZ109]|uniref:MarR family winged helix-turn-helix transcriptional regulator n=1 Tax=Enterococcus sp. AZ109 TaxID=2774634 RepID=UPI003F22E4F2
MKSNSNYISRKISFINKKQELIIRDFLEKAHLELIHIEILEYLELHPGTIQKHLTSYFGKVLQNQLVALENKGLIYRKSSITDIRQKRIFLTAEGEETLKEIKKSHDRIEQKIQGSLSLVERDTLLGLLDKVRNELN